MSYTISNYSKEQAKKLGVEIKNSKTKGKTYADKRRKLYKERHSKDCKKKNSPGFYACEILW